MNHLSRDIQALRGSNRSVANKLALLFKKQANEVLSFVIFPEEADRILSDSDILEIARLLRKKHPQFRLSRYMSQWGSRSIIGYNVSRDLTIPSR